MSLYGNLSKDNAVGAARGVSDDFYSHPAYTNMHKAHRKLEMIQSMMDEVLATVPETPTKGAAVMQLHTASMWLDKAMSEGYKALQAAFIKMEEEKRAAYTRTRAERDYDTAEAVVAGPAEVSGARRATKRA